MKPSTAIARITGKKFSILEKKMVIDAIKVRYNGILAAMRKVLDSSANKFTIEGFPAQYSGWLDADHSRFISILSAKDRKTFKDIIEGFRSAASKFNAEHAKLQERFNRDMDALKLHNETRKTAIRESLSTLKAQHDKRCEAGLRARQAFLDRCNAKEAALLAERDEFILQVSLMGASHEVNQVIESLRNPEDVAAELQAEGMEVTAEALQITGIGYPSPKQITTTE